MRFSTNLTDIVQITDASPLVPGARRRAARVVSRAEAMLSAKLRATFARMRMRERFSFVRPSTWLFTTQPEHALAYLMWDEQYEQ